MRARRCHARWPRRIDPLHLADRVVAYKDSGRKTQRSIELKLGRVVAVDGGEIEAVGTVQLLQGRNGLLGAIDQLQQVAGRSGLADADQRAVVR